MHGAGASAAPLEATLSTEDRIRLVDVIESSLRVVKRHQFYLWDQGPVQSLLPHDILICGIAGNGEEGLQFDRFSITRYFRQEHFDVVCNPRGGLMQRLMATWRKDRDPILISADPAANGSAPELARIIAENELRNVMAHGVTDIDGRVAGYFCFSRVSCELGPRLAYLVELLTPIFHATLTRVLCAEHQATHVTAARRTRPITRREVEILGWIKEGKTNNDIAQILQLSHWTVKNHMQAILKKLAVQNRSHAVARAISMGILNSGE